MNKSTMNKPFLKWAGNKFRLMPILLPHLQTNTRIIDPFMGGGSLLLNHTAPMYCGGDVNADIILVFQFLKDSPETFIEQTKTWFSPYWFDKETNDRSKLKEERTGVAKATYYELREMFNAVKNPTSANDRLTRASLFVVLNKYCFNGLCRYRPDGNFTTPWNWAHKPAPFPEFELRAAVTRMQHATVSHASFEDTICQAENGDVVYCDPPYLPLDDKPGTFTAYAKEGFTMEQQQLIVDLAEDNRTRGVTTVISNHDCSLARTMYQKANRIFDVEVKRSMNRYEGHANTASEIIAIYQANVVR